MVSDLLRVVRWLLRRRQPVIGRERAIQLACEEFDRRGWPYEGPTAIERLRVWRTLSMEVVPTFSTPSAPSSTSRARRAPSRRDTDTTPGAVSAQAPERAPTPSASPGTRETWRPASTTPRPWAAVLCMLLVLIVGLGCSSARKCWIDEPEAPLERLVVRDERLVGQTLRLRAVYQGGFEGGILAPVELFDNERSIPMGMEYCLLVVSRCQGPLEAARRYLGDGEDWSTVVDAVVEYKGHPDAVNCLGGWVRLIHLVRVSARDRPTEMRDGH